MFDDEEEFAKKNLEKDLLLFSSELELTKNNNCIMNKLIIDAAKDRIFFMLIVKDINHYTSYENTKINFEKMIVLINNFLIHYLKISKD